jgi:bifunctional DNase/RNase
MGDQDKNVMLDVSLGRIVLRDGMDRQYIYLVERNGTRGFPIVIGNNEALEIHRVVHEIEPERPLTHQLIYATILALGASVKCVDIVELRKNTFFAHIVLQSDANDEVTVIDARPSDAIALALRAKCQIRVAESVMAQAATNSEES